MANEHFKTVLQIEDKIATKLKQLMALVLICISLSIFVYLSSSYSQIFYRSICESLLTVKSLDSAEGNLDRVSEILTSEISSDEPIPAVVFKIQILGVPRRFVLLSRFHFDHFLDGLKQETDLAFLPSDRQDFSSTFAQLMDKQDFLPKQNRNVIPSRWYGINHAFSSLTQSNRPMVVGFWGQSSKVKTQKSSRVLKLNSPSHIPQERDIFQGKALSEILDRAQWSIEQSKKVIEFRFQKESFYLNQNELKLLESLNDIYHLHLVDLQRGLSLGKMFELLKSLPNLREVLLVVEKEDLNRIFIIKEETLSFEPRS